MKCPHCGAEIQDGAKFCTNCGETMSPQDSEPEEILPDEPPKKEMEKLIRIVTIAAAVLITAVIGITLGIRSYAARQYQAGVQAMENGEYAAAVKALKSAMRFGGGEDTGKLLGEAYIHTESWQEANTVLETYLEDHKSDREAIENYALSCEKLAAESLRQNEPETASEWLQKEYDLTGDEKVYKRLKAIEGGGIYADENGNVYNLDGLIETAVCMDEKGNVLYKADLTYGTDGRWQLAKAYNADDPKKSVFASFAWENNAEYELHVYPFGDEYSWIAEKTVTDSDGRVSLLETRSLTSKDVLTFSYTENRNGYLLKETITSADGDKISMEWPGEEKPDHAVMTYGSTQYIGALAYDEAGRIISFTVTKNLLQTVYQMTYQYNEDGTVSEMICRNNNMPLTSWKPMKKYSRRVIHYSNGSPISAEIYDENGKLSANGYYVENCGWLIMHHNAG